MNFSSRCNYKCDSNQDHVICQYALSAKHTSTTTSPNDSKDDKNLTDLVAYEGSCDVGWTLNEDNCYKFFETNQSWAVANTMCLKNGANLLSINSESEQIFVQNFLFTISGALEAVWLGKKQQILFKLCSPLIQQHLFFLNFRCKEERSEERVLLD